MRLLAAVPAGSEVDPCCCEPTVCAGITALDLVLSGITTCGCESVTEFTDISGINGAHSLTGLVNGTGSLIAGSAIFHYYTSDPCVTQTEQADAEFHIDVTCVDGNTYFLDVIARWIDSTMTPRAAYVFTGSGSLDTPLTPSTVVECGYTPPAGFNTGLTGAVATLSLP